MKLAKINSEHNPCFNGKLYIELAEKGTKKLNIHKLERVDFCLVGDKQFVKIINSLYETKQVRTKTDVINGRKNLIFEFKNVSENLQLIQNIGNKKLKFVTPYQKRLISLIKFDKIHSIKYSISDDEFNTINQLREKILSLNFFTMKKFKNNINAALKLKTQQDWLKKYFSPYNKK